MYGLTNILKVINDTISLFILCYRSHLIRDMQTQDLYLFYTIGYRCPTLSGTCRQKVFIYFILQATGATPYQGRVDTRSLFILYYRPQVPHLIRDVQVKIFIFFILQATGAPPYQGHVGKDLYLFYIIGHGCPTLSGACR